MGRSCRFAQSAGGVVGGSGLVLASIWTSYLAAISIGALRRRSESVERPPATSFRILVPAHDEAASIGVLLASLLSLDYPSDLVAVHVVADNCSDATAEIAGQFGVNVHERSDRTRRGKGAALNWLIEELPVIDHGVFVFVDADCILEADFLRRANTELDASLAAVQARTRISSSGEDSSTGLLAAGFAVRNFLRPTGRTGLGGSANLNGTGMVIRERVIREHRWSDSLAEDADLSIRLLLAELDVGFAPSAIVWTGSPPNGRAAELQAERWEAGRRAVAREFVPRLLARARHRETRHRWRFIDAALDLSMPSFSVLLASTIGSAVIAGVSAPRSWRAPIASVAGLSTVISVLHVIHALCASNAEADVYRSLFRTPGKIWWQLKVVFRTIRKPPDVWERTPRIDEMVVRS